MEIDINNIESILKAIQKKEIIKVYFIEDAPEDYEFLRSAKEINGVLNLNILDHGLLPYNEKIVFLFQKKKKTKS